MRRQLPTTTLLLAILAAVPAGAGTVITLEHTELPDGTARPLRMQVDGRRVAIDGAEGESRMIFRGDLQQMLVFDDQQKTYTVVDDAMVAAIAGQMDAAMKQMEAAIASLPAEQQEMARRVMRQQAAAAPADGASAERVERTSERATKADYPCVKYEVFDAANTTVRELWVTEWSNVRGHRDLATAMKSMSAFAQKLLASLSRFGGTTSGLETAIAQWSEIDGLPIVTTEIESGTPSMETVLRSIEEAKLDEAVFEPPEGYAPLTFGDSRDGTSDEPSEDGASEDD